MAGARLSIPRSPKFQDLIEEIGNRYQKRIGNNTYLVNDRGGYVAVRLHSTRIATFFPDGTITLNTDGYETTTTKYRLNHVLPDHLGIVQEKRVWYLWNRQTNTKEPFYDGMRVST